MCVLRTILLVSFRHPHVRADAKKGEEESDRTEYVPYGAMVHVHVRAVVAGRGGEGESDCVRVS